MLKTLISLALCLFLVFFYLEEKNTIFPVFQMTETPAIIAKGHYGHSLIVELSYSHEGLSEWIANLQKPYPLFLVESNWIDRSPEIVKILMDQNIEVGLLGSPKESYIEEKELLTAQLQTFQQNFGQLPLWFTTADYLIDEDLQKSLHARGINMIAPSTLFKEQIGKLNEGEIVSIPIHRDQAVNFEQINTYMKENDFISIEENLFGYEITTKRFP